MRGSTVALLGWGLFCGLRAPVLAADLLPFQQKVEVYCDEEGDVKVFTLRLEQPFVADEFEKSSYLRLGSPDKRAYLIYPKEAKFQQKHAEFYGRLRGEGTVDLKLAYEIVSENPDGSRRVQVREGAIQVEIPGKPAGSNRIYKEWARQQNLHFAELLRYYPQETFFQYCLLQSRARYGVEPPPTATLQVDRSAVETGLYQAFSGALAMQESLQRETLSGGRRVGDLTRHISSVRPPTLRSLPYEKLLEEKRTREGIEPKVHEVARLVPADQYLLHFHSMASLDELLDLSSQWGNGLLRLFTVRAEDSQFRKKLDDQLCIRRKAIGQLFADKVVEEVAVTGADPFVAEGTDVTMIFRVGRPEVFRESARGWLEEVRKRHPAMVDREFNYREHKVAAHYTNDRVVSSFSVEHEGWMVYSNSHRAIRRLVDVAVGLAPSLYEEPDYRYVTTILPPSESANAGYLFASEASIRRLVGPAAKISEKRRLQCFNNLVMLNNAALFYRMEYGRSPRSLSELIEGRFVDAEKIVCPHGGSYAFDAEHDMCTCSLHNRLRYLTPNVELSVLNVSEAEASEYEGYKRRYQAFWQTVFDPLAVRITVGPRVRLETCVLPFANGSLYEDLRGMLDEQPRPIGTGQISASAVASLVMVPGRDKVASYVAAIPGVDEVLKSDPTLTDLKWLGDRVGLHFCDGETILHVDPTELGASEAPMLGQLPLSLQALASAVVMAANVPVYVTVEVENEEYAARLLEALTQQIFLKKGNVVGGLQAQLDAYRLPDYKEHAIYVFSAQLYVLRLRFHVALVGNRLVAATKPEILQEVIDASMGDAGRAPVEAHAMLRLNRRAVDRLYDDLELYWAEKSRIACHRNIASIYNLCKLYDISAEAVPGLSEAKYGVRYFCPEQGVYTFDAERDEVVCSVHGNRKESRQNPRPGGKSSFAELMESVDEVILYLRFRDEALLATVEIVRSGTGPREARR